MGEILPEATMRACRKISCRCKSLRCKMLIARTHVSLIIEGDPGRSVEWGLESQFCQPILLQTKCTGFNNGSILHVGKIFIILYGYSEKKWPLL